MTTPDRDRSLEQWLRQTPIPGAEPELCLDAETLAAWSEGELDGPSLASAEAHASSCGRCQAMLAAMARTAPAPAPSTGWFGRKWMMMLAPAAAAAAAVALWVAVDRPTEQSVMVPASNVPAAPAATSARELAPSVPASPAPIEKDAGAASDAKVSLDKLPSRTLADARSEQEKRPDADKDAGKEVGSAAVQFRRDAGVNERKAENTIAVAPSTPTAPQKQVAEPAAAPPPAPQQINQAQTQAASGPRQQAAAPASESVSVSAERPLTSAAAGRLAADSAGGRGGAAGGVVDEALRARKVASIEAIAPGASTRWRVVQGRIVERSSDGGATWANQYTADESTTFVAGASPSPTVCWFVGRAGAVVVSADGRTWNRVPVPERVDLVSVTPVDARSATVTAVDGRVYTTADGGATWARR